MKSGTFEDEALAPAVARILAAVTRALGYDASSCLVRAGSAWREVASFGDGDARRLCDRWGPTLAANAAARETLCDALRVEPLDGAGRVASVVVPGDEQLAAVLVLGAVEDRASDGAPAIGTITRELAVLFERHATRRRLAESEARYRGVVDAIKEAIFHIDASGCWTFLNRAWTEITGYAIADCIGKPFAAFVHPDDRAFMQGRFLAMLDRDSSARREVRCLTADGGFRWVEVVASLTVDESGAPTGLAGTAIDVHARKERDLELVRAKEQAESATRAKSDFLAVMSHELRTPLNGIVGMAEVALETALSAEQRGYLEVMRSSARGLLTIVEDVLDFSRIEARTLHLAEAPFELRRLLLDILRPLALQAAAKGLELLVAVAPEVPLRVVGDAVRLGQVVTNLVGNAVKYTHVGEINVALAVVQHEADRLVLEFQVRDTGIGIDADRQARLFEGVERAAAARRHDGAGLGLPIAARLVSLMGGTIAVSSAPGAGSTFRAVVQVEAAPRGEGLPQPLQRVSAVVLERHPRSRALIARMLRRVGAAPIEVKNARAACVELTALRAEGAPAVALVDEHADAGDRAAIAEAAAGAVIVLAYPGVRAVLDQATARYPRLLRPVYEDELVEKVLAAVSPAAAERDPEPAPAPPAGRGLRLLVVDDDPVGRRVARAVLERAGHAVVEADGGRAALVALDEIRIDLVFMDLDLPGLDGVETTRRLREREAATGRSRVPVVAFTPQTTPDDRARACDVGIDELLARPYTPSALLQTIERCGRSRRAIDLPALLDRFAGDGRLVQQLARVYCGERTLYEARLREAVSAGDTRAVQRLAHRIEGALLSLAAPDAAAAARALELASRDGDPQRVGTAFASLIAQLNALDGELQRLLGPPQGREMASDSPVR